jgi:hypothetical protein
MKITGAKVVSGEEKSKQEIEAKLVEQHTEQVAEVTSENSVDAATSNAAIEAQEEVKSVDTPETQKIDDGVVLSYLGNKLGRDVSSFDDLVEVREKEVELPEDVSAFYNYKKETGRSLKDFMELQRDYDSMNPDDVLKSYYMQTSKGLDASDVEFELNKKFGYDQDLDDDDEIKYKEISKKKEIAKAIEYFDQQREQYKAPLESSSPLVSEDKLKKFEAYEQYEADSAKQQEEANKRSEYFTQKTNELYSDKFEGFKFKYGDNEVVWKPNDVSNMTPENTSYDKFVMSHLDDNGYLKDAEAYHRAMAIARDPEAFANYFIEQGRSMAVNDVVKQGKNVDMDVRSTPSQTGKGGLSAKVINPSGGNKLRINIKN